MVSTLQILQHIFFSDTKALAPLTFILGDVFLLQLTLP